MKTLQYIVCFFVDSEHFLAGDTGNIPQDLVPFAVIATYAQAPKAAIEASGFGQPDPWHCLSLLSLQTLDTHCVGGLATRPYIIVYGQSAST